MNKRYDVAVIGGGPAGYTAALYCARGGLSVAVLEQLGAGGQMATTSVVENYPGFDEGVDGFDLGERMQRGAERYGAETLLVQVEEVRLTGRPKLLTTSEGTVEAGAVIVATGASPRRLGLPGEQELRSRGVAYCASCDGMLFRDKVVAVNGGGNTAVEDALTLAKICRKVYLIHRRDQLRADRVYWKRLEESGVEVLWNTRVAELLREQRLTGLVLENVTDGSRRTLACDGLFVAVGCEPETRLFQGQLDLDRQGYVRADETTRTNLPGVFAAGDVRTKEVRQIVTAAADGAAAAHGAQQYLLGLEKP